MLDELVGSLSPIEDAVAATLAVAGSAALPAEALAAVHGETTVEPALEGLRARALAEQDGDGRWHLSAEATAHFRRRDLAATAAPLIRYLADSASAAANPEQAAQVGPAILGTLQWARSADKWEDVRLLSRAAERALALAGRFGAWGLTLEALLESAKALNDRTGEAYAHHQLGTKALLVGENEAARSNLAAAVRLRRQLGDKPGVAASKRNLALVPRAPGIALVRRFGALGKTKGLLLLLVVVSVVAAGGTTAGILITNGPHVEPPSLDRDKVSFGSIAFGQTVRRRLIFNSGSKNQTITAISTGLQDFNARRACLTVIPTKTTCVILLTFSPAADGPRKATLSVTLADGSSLQSTLNGTGVAAPVEVSLTPSVALGDVQVGQSQMATLTLAAGSRDRSVSTISTGGSAEFQADQACRGELKANTSCGIKVTFSPAADGPRKATLSVTLADGSSLQSTLNGTGVAAPVEVSLTPSVALGDVQVGQSQMATLTLAAGSRDRSVSTISTGGSAEFQADQACRGELKANTSCGIKVTFSPAADGPRKATLSVTLADGSSLQSTLNGTGVAAPVEVSLTPSVALGDVQVGQSQMATLTLAAGSRDRSVSTISTGGSAEFQADQACRGELKANTSCGIKVTFSPAADGPRKATLSVTLADGSSLQSTLNGTGVAAPVEVSLTPSVALGDVQVGQSQMATLTLAAGSRDRSVSTISTGGSAEFQADQACRGELKANTSCGIKVTFSPAADGPRKATLSVTLADGSSLQSTLNGTGFLMADLGVSFAKLPSSRQEQSRLVVYIAVSNRGPQSAPNALLDLSVPTSTGVSVSFNRKLSTCSLPCKLGTLEAGRRRTVTLVYDIGPLLAKSGAITLTANVRSDARDSNGGATAPATVTLFAVDPSLTPSVALGDVQVGQSQMATLTLAAGSRDRSVSTISTGGSAEFQADQACRGELKANTSCGIKVTFSPAADGPRKATLSVTLADGSSLQSTLNGTGFLMADLGVSFAKLPSSRQEQSRLVVYIAVSNRGPQSAPNALLDLSVPTSTGVSVSFNRKLSTCSLPCKLGTLEAGRRRTVTLVYDIGPLLAKSGAITLTANVRSDARDSNGGATAPAVVKVEEKPKPDPG